MPTFETPAPIDVRIEAGASPSGVALASVGLAGFPNQI